MVNAPYNEDQDWAHLIQECRTQILRRIEKSLGVDVKAHIVEEDVLDPLLIESRTASYKGSIYGQSSNHWSAAFLRHPNFSSKVKGLYFCGGSVHPGGGIPLCLLSAKITSDVIIKGK
jgi:phytoene dehydrogenase-like protein